MKRRVRQGRSVYKVFMVAWIRRELNTLGIPPLRRFGQHFLVDKEVREKLIEAAALKDTDTVLEIGPGLGFLTTHLAARAGRVIAIEKDRTLANYLNERFAGYRNLTVLQGDALTIKIPDFTKIVSSPPYNISSKLILQTLKTNFQLAALLLQDEFVRRLTAASGSRDYGRLTVMFQSRAVAKLIMKVPRSAFYPKPRVDSAIVTITPMKEQPVIKDAELFSDMVRSLFTQRRRKLRGVLTRYLKARHPGEFQLILQRTSIPEKRVYEVNPQELATLSNELTDIETEIRNRV
jgi:16S rRNA (adenine1518-N6/adenine1519-N6)-dimethyltransferase